MRNEYRDLFEYAAGFVTPADVAANGPGDPGYLDCVRAVTRVLETREPPAGYDEGVVDAISWNRSLDAEDEEEPVRFRRFRVFINAAGLAMGVYDDVLPGNNLAAALLDDAHGLGDRRLLELLAPAFAAEHDRLHRARSEEAPFLLLGHLLARAELGATDAEIAGLAERLMAEEAEHFGRASGDFLFGCSCFDSFGDQWRAAVARVLVPATPAAALLREALLAE